MNKTRFVFWYIAKSFKAHIKRWLFPITVMICGLLILNITVCAMLATNLVIKDNFVDNNDLRFLQVSNDAKSASFTYGEAKNFSKDSRFLFAPLVSYKTEPLDIIDGDEHRSLRYIALPYELLDYIGLSTEITEEQWSKDIIILNEEFENSTDRLSLPAHEFVKQKFLQSSEVLDEIKGKEIPLEIYRSKSLYLPKTWEGYSIISFDTWMKLEAMSLNQSVEQFEKSVTFPEGMAVIVNEFQDIDLIAQNLRNSSYNVVYALDSFENLTQTIQTIQISVVVFSLLISIIVLLTNLNTINQFLYHQKREIGLMKSMGVDKKTMIEFTFGEVLLQGIIVLIVILPIQIVVIQYIMNSFFEKYSSNAIQITITIFFMNFLFILLISIFGGAIPIIKVANKKIVDLLMMGE